MNIYYVSTKFNPDREHEINNISMAFNCSKNDIICTENADQISIPQSELSIFLDELLFSKSYIANIKNIRARYPNAKIYLLTSFGSSRTNRLELSKIKVQLIGRPLLAAILNEKIQRYNYA